MPRISILNFILGFLTIILAASFGSFLANSITKQVLEDSLNDVSWQFVLLKSAHSHSNLFGFLQILFGLTLPYSKLSTRFKVFQTWGIFSGVISMSLILCAKSFFHPASVFSDFFYFTSVILLSLFIFSLCLHCYGLSLKLVK